MLPLTRLFFRFVLVTIGAFIILPSTGDSSYALANSLLKTTARITCITSNGESRVGTASYFMFSKSRENGSRIVPALVTCRHVVDGAVVTTITITTQCETNASNEEMTQFVVPDGEKMFVRHPSQTVDLVALPMIGVMANLFSEGKRFKLTPINSDLFPAQGSDLGAMMPIAMVGYPIGLWDEKNNLPLMRRGVSASNPNMDYNGRREFLIDAACFPGSSGSPVFLYEEGFVNNNGVPSFGRRALFLGVLYAGPEYNKEGKIVVRNVPTRFEPRAETSIPVNVGFVIRYDVVREFCNVLIPADVK